MLSDRKRKTSRVAALLALLAVIAAGLTVSAAQADTTLPAATPFSLTVTKGSDVFTYTPNGTFPSQTGPSIPVADGDALSIAVSGQNFARLQARQCAGGTPINNSADFNPDFFNRCTSVTLGGGQAGGFRDSGPVAPGTTNITIPFAAGAGTAPALESQITGEINPGFTCGVGSNCQLVVRVEVAGPPASSNFLSFPLDFGGTAAGECVSGPNTVSIGDAAVLEGDSGKERSLKLPVTLANNLNVEATVDYNVIPGTATVPADLPKEKGLPKTIKFKPAASSGLTATQKYVVVKVAPDLLNEGNETFTVELSNPTGGLSLGRSVATGTIVDDEASGQSVAITPMSACEGNAFTPSASGAPKTNKLVFNVVLSEPAATDLELAVTVADGTATGDLPPFDAPLGDYKGFNKPKPVKFRAGQFQKTVTVQNFADTDVEGDETIVATITDAGGVPVQIGSANSIILNDD